MSIFSKLFKTKKTSKKYNKNDFVDDSGEVTKSAIIYDRNNDRLLKLENDSCAMVMHGRW